MLYPPKCIVCNKAIYNEGYCKACRNKITPIRDFCCFNCGLPINQCECDRFIYHFDGIACLYFNEGYAQQAVYDFKFKGIFSCVNVFGDELAKKAKDTFGIENIDIVTCVPASKKSVRVRGFNQSLLLAKRVAHTLNKPFDATVLFKDNDVKLQHHIRKLDDRFDNVRGAYFCNQTVKCKNVLLVDDIKTTGASLDECARQLKFAGAENVFCVTVLVTPLRKKSNDS